MFWLGLTIFFDPGGFIETYVTRDLIGGIKITDITFLLLLIPLISHKVRIVDFFQKKDNKWFFVFLSLYAVLYHCIVYGYIAQGGDLSKFKDFLQYQRLTTWGFLAIIPAYIFFQRDYKLLFYFALSTSLLVMLSYFITLTTNLDIIPLLEFERSRGSSIMRISVISYGFADWFLIIYTICYFFKIELPYKKIIAIIGVTVFFAVILTLTRRTILAALFSIIYTFYLHQKMSKKPFFATNEIIRSIFIGLIFIALLSFFKPEYIKYTIQSIDDTFAILTTGKDTGGDADGRVEGDIPKHIERFKDSPLFGYGWDPLWYSNQTEDGGLSANDVPITAALGMFGIIGLLLFTPYYLKIFKVLIDFRKLLFKFNDLGLKKDFALLYVFGLYFLIYFVTRYTVYIMLYFEELIMGFPRINLMVLTGFMLAAKDKIALIISSHLLKKQNNFP